MNKTARKRFFLTFFAVMCLICTMLGILAVDYNTSQIGFDAVQKPPLLDQLLAQAPRLKEGLVLLPKKLALLLQGGAFAYQMRQHIAQWLEDLMSPVTEEYGDAQFVQNPAPPKKEPSLV